MTLLFTPTPLHSARHKLDKTVGLFPTSRYTAAIMEQSTPPNAGQPPEVLVAALKKLLRPLVRLMLSYQITYPYLVALLKQIYVEVADNEFQVEGKKQSDSRINLLTGVHRKDVKRLRSEAYTEAVTPGNVSTGARLIAYWIGSEEFVDEQGRPRPLSLRSSAVKSGDTSEPPGFDDLVEAVCKQDIRPRVILDEWLNMGIAHVDDRNRVVLNTGAFTPERGFEEKAWFFGKNLHDHISAGSHNLLGGDPPYFDRSVYYDKLSAESVKELNALATELGMAALTRMNKQALNLQKKDVEKVEADSDENDPSANTKLENYRINFGIFNYNTEMPSKQNSKPRGDQDA